MNTAFPMLALAAMALPASAMAAQITPSAEHPVVELSVTETVDSAPDTATFGTGVTSKALTAKEALQANSVAMDKLIKQIQKLGVDAKDIQTTGISLNAEYDYNNGETPRFVGYQVSNSVMVKVRNLDSLGSLLDAIVSEGPVNNLYGPTFSIDDDAAAKRQARERALDRGKAQAMEYAQKAGFSGVQLLSVSESLNGNSVYESGGSDARFKSAVAVAVPIAPGQVGTSVTVNVAYEMVR